MAYKPRLGPSEKKRQISVSFSEPERRRLIMLAAKEGLTISDTIRRCVAQQFPDVFDNRGDAQ